MLMVQLTTSTILIVWLLLNWIATAPKEAIATAAFDSRVKG